MKTVKLLLVTTLLLLITACQPSLEKHSETTINAGFDTMFQLIGYTEDKDEFDQYFEDLKKEAYRMHQLFDIYNDYEGINNLKTINDQAGIRPVKVDPTIIDLLQTAKSYSEKTKGYFDVTLGSVLSIWHEYREAGKQLNQTGKYGPSPSIDILSNANKHTGLDLLEIDEEQQTVFLKDPKASLDVGAIAKGYAVEKIAQKLEHDGLKHGIVNGGGNIRTINYKPDDSTFNVGITNPNNLSGPSLLTLKLDQSTAIVTSGDYERYFIDDQKRHQHHIINPKTLYPTQGIRSVTIVHPNSTTADILSTVFTVADINEANEISKQFDDQLGIVWVFDNKQETSFNELKQGEFFIYYNDFVKHLISID